MTEDATLALAPAVPDTETVHDPLWYQDAVIYELHIKAYADANGDGIGDFRGLTQHLDRLFYPHDARCCISIGRL